MSHADDRLWRERAALRYLDAHDASDLESIAALWEQAERDPNLERLLRELDEGLEQEGDPSASRQADESRVLELARASLPSAFPQAVDLAPLTVAEVACRLRGDPQLWRQLGPEDRRANDALAAMATPVPEELSQPALERWISGLGVSAGPGYWRTFRKAAVLMAMARCQQEGNLAAARQATPRPKPKGEPS